MFDMICPFPCEESVPSLRTIIVGVCPPKDMVTADFVSVYSRCGQENGMAMVGGYPTSSREGEVSAYQSII